jgi:hypothetical protein
MPETERINLGWANSWQREPEIVTTCKAKGHKQQEADLDRLHRGCDHLYWCDECGYEYHVDSSD